MMPRGSHGSYAPVASLPPSIVARRLGADLIGDVVTRPCPRSRPTDPLKTSTARVPWAMRRPQLPEMHGIVWVKRLHLSNWDLAPQGLGPKVDTTTLEVRLGADLLLHRCCCIISVDLPGRRKEQFGALVLGQRIPLGTLLGALETTMRQLLCVHDPSKTCI